MGVVQTLIIHKKTNKNKKKHDELRIALNDIQCFLLADTQQGDDTKPAVVLIICVNPLLSGPR